ncbi:MAG: hypothetical protein ACK4S2_06945 [Gemmobacter sp.]|uniref:hypothetical protein n=1 Tax=Gemmobacter sp. TaxID=1898957 RepID=UPI00391BF23F
MTAQDLSFRITADTGRARDDIRRVADDLRGLGNAGRSGAGGLRDLGAGLSQTGSAGQQAARAAQLFGANLASSVPAIGGAAQQLQQIGGVTAGLPPLMGAAALAGAALGAALAAVGAKSVAAFAAMETQMLTTEQVIRATGGAAGRTWEDINRLALDLGRNTLASTTGVRAAATQLLTFRSIAGETFDRTIRAAQDLAAVGFGTIESAAVQLGKALENPEQGLSALTKVGVSFSAAQKEVIKQLMATGQAAQAQGLILQQIEAQVGGAGAAAGGGLAGAFDTLAENSGRLFEVLGSRVAELTRLEYVVGTIANGARRISEALAPEDADFAAVTDLVRQINDARDQLAQDDARAAWHPFRLTPGQRATILSDIEEMEAELRAISARRLAEQEEIARRSAEEQARIAEERYQGVITALQREAEQAGLTKVELDALNRAREAGVDPSLPGNVARYQEILDLQRQIAAARAQAGGEKLLGELEREAELRRAIATHGEASAQVAALRAAHERAALEEQIKAANYSADLARAILDAYDAKVKLSNVDIAAGIAAARAEAVGLARQLGVALDVAVQIRAQAALDAMKVEFSPGGQAMVAYGSRSPQPTPAQQAIATRNAPPPSRRAVGSGAVGGGASRVTVAGLAAQGTEILGELSLAQAAVAEKVRAGLLSVAEGSDAVADAKARAADQLAELIARLDRLGPAGKAAAETARQALADLGVQAQTVGEELRRSLIENFEENFARSIASGKSAMTAFADHVLMELTRAFTRKYLTPFITPLIDGLMSLFPFAQGGVVGARGVIPFATGGVPDLPPLAAHRNQVVGRPTLFAIRGGADTGLMGEAGPEAILPLRPGPQGPGVLATGPGGATVLPLQRAPGGALGVALPDLRERMRPPQAFAQGGVIGRMAEAPRVAENAALAAEPAGTPPRQIVNIINNHPNARIERRERADGQTMTMDVMIEQVESAITERAARGVGSLAGMLGDRYGLARVGR